jgi:preprotein translocase subunit SecD
MRPAIAFKLDERGGRKLSQLTGRNLERPLCVFVDDEAVSAATIQSMIYESGQITGSFTLQEAARIARILGMIPLPAQLKVVGVVEPVP